MIFIVGSDTPVSVKVISKTRATSVFLLFDGSVIYERILRLNAGFNSDVLAIHS